MATTMLLLILLLLGLTITPLLTTLTTPLHRTDLMAGDEGDD